MVALGAFEVLHAQAVVVGHGVLNAVTGDHARFGVLEQFAQRLARQLHVDGPAGQAGIGRQAGHAALQLAHVGVDLLGDQRQDVVADVEVLKLRLFAQDGQARLEIRPLDIGHQAALKAAAQALLQLLNLLGRLIGGHHDLLAGLAQVVERMEKLLLRAVLARDELNIVHHEDVHVAEAFAELLVLVGLHGADQLVGKVLAGDV